MYIYSRSKRFVLTIFLTIFLSVNLFGMFAFARPANAAVMDAGITAAFTGKWTWEQVGNSLISAALGALVNAASYFMRKLAYDAATYVSSGGKGQGAQAFTQDPRGYFETLAKDSTASAIEEFGKPFGLNLCQTPDLKVQVYLQVGLRNLYSLDVDGKGAPQPSCEWNNLKNSWSSEAFEQKYGAGGSKFLAETFDNALRIEQTDFGIALGAMAKLDRIKTDAVVGGQAERIEGQGYKALTNLISGETKTPAQIIKTETEAITAKQSSELSSKQIAGIYGSGSLQIIPSALSVFVNTLTSQLLNKLMSGGLFGGGGSSDGGGGAALDFYAQYVTSNRKAAEQAFSFLFTAVPQKQLSSYDIITEFASCPDNPSLNNCVIDSRLQQAITRANTGNPLTIQEAIAEGLLDKNRPLISPRRIMDNVSYTCYTNGYCYSNLQKLRKARILPIGFELAAEKSDPDQPWTLGQVVDGFEDCARDSNGNAYADSRHPFCHLIDPNWIIWAPEARCEAKVYGPVLESSDGGWRKQECADISTCLLEDAQGSCISPFSYCLREKNVWQIGGTDCPAHYSTCSTYFDKRGSAVSYLSRTLDFGACNLDAVGCRAYSTEKTGDNWQTSEQSGVTASLDLKTLGRNQTVFFNDKIKNYTCSAKDNGCSEFLSAGVNIGSQVYLKKAPDYLGCYDIDVSVSSPEIDWPQTKPDLLALADRPEECKSFAQVCLPEEVGCEMYRSASGGADIPGVIGNNVCSSVCVGYDTYKQEATNFSPMVFPKYFIPNNGLTCSAVDVGCAEFTNIDEVARGGEGREYYTDLRYCELPDGNNEKTFYSWEGSDSAGYVLQVHKMLQIDNEDINYINSLTTLGVNADRIKNSFKNGSPAYVDDSAIKLTENDNLCNAQKYNVLINNPYSLEAAHPDCRALYDDRGEVFYRLLAETVTVSESCHPLRKTESEMYIDEDIDVDDVYNNQNVCKDLKGGDIRGDSCYRCYRGGTYDNGACIYWTISAPGQSSSCTPTANNCRSYIGNTGNNIREVINLNFEPVGTDADALNLAKKNWSGTETEVEVRPEAIQVGQYSLDIRGTVSYTFTTSSITNNDWYELSFWAKGVSQNLRIYLENNGQSFEFTFSPLTSSTVKAPIGAEWQQYRLGPVFFSGDLSQPVKLTFESDKTNVQYYLDNVRLTRLQDHIYLIRDSWKTVEGYDVPLVCDSNPTDPYPGSALGCREYQDSRNNSVYTTGFAKLCRPEAVGCQPFYDTYNTREPNLTAYKLWCNKTGNTSNICNLSVTIGGEVQELGSCTVVRGQSGCYVEKVVLPTSLSSPDDIPGAEIKPATVVIPADTPDALPIYLTSRQEFSCLASNLGCQKIALEERQFLNNYVSGSSSYQFSETYYKNNPANYTDTLCDDSLVGCEEFKSGSEIVYFKNPKILGSVMCSYKTNVNIDGTTFSGWYRDGAGRCSNNNNICQADADCNAPGEIDKKCNLSDFVPCYENYLQAGAVYGIWSNTSVNYRGLVGTCPANQSGCTELVDPADTSQLNPEGKPYYVIFNQEIERKTGECQGKAGLKDGCVLFNRTDVPNKIYNSSATYLNSSRLPSPDKYSSVPIVTTPTTGQPNSLDTNIVLKVERDRQCSEWLACRSYTVKYDENNKPTKLCYEFQRCRAMNSAGECVDWVLETDPLNFQTLSADYYIARDTGWHSEEYSGYSMLNKYQIGNYAFASFDGQITDPQYLYHKVNAELLGGEISENCSIVPPAKEDSKDGDICGLSNAGRCWRGSCLYPLNGAFPTDVEKNNLKTYLEQGICKAYPEKDSPFSSYQAVSDQSQIEALSSNGKVRTIYQSRRSEYEKANICQFNSDCSCGYVKLTYKNSVTDYWPLHNSATNVIIPDGVCISGDKEGYPCEVGGPQGQCGGTETTATDGETKIWENPGQCARLETRVEYEGQLGFCLEYDLSRPLGVINRQERFACLTWLPLEMSASGIDVYNYYLEAGYYPSKDAENSPGEVYCTNSNANGGGTYNNLFGHPTKAWMDICKDKELTNDYMCTMLTWLPPEQNSSVDAFKRWRIDLGYFNDYDDPRWEFGVDSLWLYSFDWFRYKENLKYFSKNNLIAFLQLYAWYGMADNVIQKYNQDSQSLGKTTIHPDIMLWYMKDPWKWMESILYFSHGENRPFYNYSRSDFINLAPASSGGYDMNTQFYNTDIRRIYFTPFVFHYDDGMLDCGADAPIIWTDEIFIDFEQLDSLSYYDENEEKNETCNPENSEGSVCLQYVRRTARYKDYYSTGNNKELTYFTFTGTNITTKQKIYGVRLLGVGADEKAIIREMMWFINNYGDDENPWVWGSGGVQPRYSITWEISVDDKGKGILSKPSESYGLLSETLKEGNCSGGGVGPENRSYTEFNTASYLGALVEFKPRCTEFVVVHKNTYDTDERYLTRNKAWTNRVWEFAKKIYTLGNSQGDNSINFNKDISTTPYGSISLREQDVEDINLLRNYIFNGNGAGADGYPLSCWDKLFAGNQFVMTYFSSSWRCQGLINYLPEGDWNSYVDVLKYIPPGGRVDPNFGLQGGYLDQDPAFSGDKILAKFFTKAFNVMTRNNTGNESQYSSSSWDYSGENFVNKNYFELSREEIKLMPPRIYSLNPATCLGKMPGAGCGAGELNNITVGNKNGTMANYDRDADGRADEDLDNDSNPDYNYGLSQYFATAKFFAFADENRMPIKRVMVDWGDGSFIANKVGWYKNHLPYCADSDSNTDNMKFCFLNNINTQLSCQDPKDCPVDGTYDCKTDSLAHFGVAKRACEESYFEYAHSYTCTQNDKNKDWAFKTVPGTVDGMRSGASQVEQDIVRKLRRMGVTSDWVCIFQPKVQVLDNWGWCNGTCTDLNDTDGDGNRTELREGCYNGVAYKECDINTLSTNNQHWTTYQGKIIVVPRQN